MLKPQKHLTDVTAARINRIKERLAPGMAFAKASSEVWEALYQAIPGAREPMRKWDKDHRSLGASTSGQPRETRRLPSAASRLMAAGEQLPVLFNSAVVVSDVQTPLPDSVRQPTFVGWADDGNGIHWNTKGGKPGSYVSLTFLWMFSAPEQGIYRIVRSGPEPELVSSAQLIQFWPHEWCNIRESTASYYVVRHQDGTYENGVSFPETEIFSGKRDAWTHDGPNFSYQGQPTTLPDTTSHISLESGDVVEFHASLDVVWHFGAGGDVAFNVNDFYFGGINPDSILVAVKQ
jgi:hypothetical protein